MHHFDAQESETDQSQLPLPSCLLSVGVLFDAGLGKVDQPRVPSRQDAQRKDRGRAQQELECQQVMKVKSVCVPRHRPCRRRLQ